MGDLTEQEELLREHAEAVVVAQESVDAARAERDEAIREAIREGMSMYRVAQVVGISQQAVARIRDAG